MSLREAVLDVANQLEESMDLLEDRVTARMLLISCIGQLRIAVKAASPGPEQEAWERENAARGQRVAQTAFANPQADALLQQAKERVVKEETLGGSMAICKGGNADGDMVPIGGMPVDAFTMVVGQVYQLQADGNLHYREDKTKGILSSASP